VRFATLEIVRCPYCGGRVDVKRELFHRTDEDGIVDAVLGCHCCHFAVVSGIAVLTLEGQADTARQQIEDGNPDAALLTMLGIDEEGAAEQLRSPSITYRDIVALLGSSFEGGYFLYRFSDPTFITADAVVRALAAATITSGERVVDLCGGSGHLTRTLSELSTTPPVLMDLSYVKLWLAQRFTAPGCDAVCADGHSPLPFASGAFRLAVCNDAFHYIWTKALFAREMVRLIDGRGVAAITHVHNAEQWNPSAGNPLPPSGYRDLFEGLDTRVFPERGLLADAIAGHLNLGRSDPEAVLNADPALSVVASRDPHVFADRPIQRQTTSVRGTLAINPLYSVTIADQRAHLKLAFPSKDYEDEYEACRLYLPENVTIDRSTLEALRAGATSPEMEDLRARRVVLDLPPGYL
jgi:SAM-dependent methyltransferase